MDQMIQAEIDGPQFRDQDPELEARILAAEHRPSRMTQEEIQQARRIRARFTYGTEDEDPGEVALLMSSAPGDCGNRVRFPAAGRGMRGGPWQWDPGLYLATISEGVTNLVVREFAPGAQRLSSVTRRIDRIPALLQVARTNLHAPTPAIKLPDQDHVDLAPPGGLKDLVPLRAHVLRAGGLSSTRWVMLHVRVSAYSSRGWAWALGLAFGFIGTPDSGGSSLPIWCTGYDIGSRKSLPRLDFVGYSGPTNAGCQPSKVLSTRVDSTRNPTGQKF